MALYVKQGQRTIGQECCFECRITRMFNNTPKGGWFGGYVSGAPTGTTDCIKGRHGDVMPETGKKIALRAIRMTDGQYEWWEILNISEPIQKKEAIARAQMVKGIGPAKAEAIYNIAKGAILLDLQANKDAYIKKGLSEEQYRSLCEKMGANEGPGALMAICPSLSQKKANNICEALGDGVVRMVAENPWYLLGYTVKGLRFADVDLMAQDLGTSKSDPERLKYCVGHCVESLLSDGWYDGQARRGGGHSFLDLDDPACRRALDFEIVKCVDDNYSVQMADDLLFAYPDQVPVIEYKNKKLIYSQGSYAAEKKCAMYLSNMAWKPGVLGLEKQHIGTLVDQWEIKTGVSLDPLQKDAVIGALSGRTAAIKGGPGTGKTLTIRAIAEVYETACHKKAYLSSFTNKAVRRIRETMGLDSDSDAGYVKTVMSFICNAAIQEAKKSRAGSKWCLSDEYAGQLLIIDECSMLGLYHASQMLEIFEKGQVIFVGDADQLPSISPGQFFKDICSCSAVPVYELKSCFRQKGNLPLLEFAAAVRENRQADMKPVHGMIQPTLWDASGNFLNLADTSWITYVAGRMKDMLANGYEPKDICVLTPLNKHAAGTAMANLILQDCMNPLVPYTKGDPSAKGNPVPGTAVYAENEDGTRVSGQLRVGDRFVWTENTQTLGLVNGDTGEVAGFADGNVFLKMDDGSDKRVGFRDIGALELGYAITVHKSQGSEYRAVFLLLDGRLVYTPGCFACKNLFYTGVTRPKEYLEIVGSQAAIMHMCNTPCDVRNSLLVDRLMGRLMDQVMGSVKAGDKDTLALLSGF